VVSINFWKISLLTCYLIFTKKNNYSDYKFTLNTLWVNLCYVRLELRFYALFFHFPASVGASWWCWINNHRS
jgi:hypothetical protein